jgi:hypothetical protein
MKSTLSSYSMLLKQILSKDKHGNWHVDTFIRNSSETHLTISIMVEVMMQGHSELLDIAVAGALFIS